MRTIVFNQGFNRVENRCIIQLERTKLNRLLDEERRIIEMLTRSAEKIIKSKPQSLADSKIIWSNIINHRLVRDIRCRLDCLTDAYPQFVQQVKAVRDLIKERFLVAMDALRDAAQISIYRPN
ncbi:MAG TPA: hypothetical protein PKY82_08110 [Pyrinomonadaceae bacterium]|nr:hypothetical protein [Pyrinomonadaceae bacterium]